MLAQLYPVQGFHSIITMHFSLFPSSFPMCHSKRAHAVFHLAVPTSQGHLAQDLILPPHSLFPSPPSMTASQHSQKSCPLWHQGLKEPLRSLILRASSLEERYTTSHSTQGMCAGREAQLFQVQMFSYCTVTFISFFFKRDRTSFCLWANFVKYSLMLATAMQTTPQRQNSGSWYGTCWQHSTLVLIWAKQ